MTLRVPTEAPALAGVCGTSSASAVAARQSEQARLRSPSAAVGGGQICKRGFAASGTTDSNVSTFVNSIRYKIVYCCQNLFTFDWRQTHPNKAGRIFVFCCGTFRFDERM